MLPWEPLLVGGLLIFAVGLFMVGDRRKLFSKDFEDWTEFKELGGVQMAPR